MEFDVSEKNVHQQKKDLLKEINFYWHSPRVSPETQTRVLDLLAEARELLLGSDRPKS
jgi:hypothetical protein